MTPFGKKFSLSLAMALTAALALVSLSACTQGEAKGKPNYVFKPQTKPNVLAKIGNEEITEEELIGDDKLDFFDLKKREYELRMDRLHQLLIDDLIGKKAKAAGMSTDQWIEKNITHGPVKISNSEYKKFIEDKKIPESQINPQIKQRINAYLANQKKDDLVDSYLAKVTKDHPVEVYFQKPKMNIKVDVGNAPVWGHPNAPVTIIEFSDFQCPFCGRAATTMMELRKKYGPSKISLAYKQFPLPMHPRAMPAAEASLCVYEQGNDKFWKWADTVFTHQQAMEDDDLAKYAKDAGADVAKYKQCVSSHKYASAVQKDMQYGESLGVKSTPTFFINGELVAGAVPIENFEEIINDDLAEAHKK